MIQVFKKLFLKQVFELFHLFPFLASKTNFSKQEMELFHQFLELGSQKNRQIHNTYMIKGFKHKFWEQEMEFFKLEIGSKHVYLIQ